MKPFILLLLLCFCHSIANSRDTDLQILQARCDTALGKISGYPENFELAATYGSTGYNMTPESDVGTRATFAFATGVAHYSLMRFDSADIYFDRALTCATAAHNPEIMNAAASALLVLRLQIDTSSDNQRLLGMINAVMDTTENIKARQKGYNGLGNYYYIKSFYATAQNYYTQGIRLNEEIADTSQETALKKELAVQYYNLCKIYLTKKMHDKAISALHQGSRYKNLSQVIQRRYHAAYVDIYTMGERANLDTALHYYRLLEAQADTSSAITSEMVTSNLSLVQYYLSRNEVTQAKPYLQKASVRAASSKMPFLIHQVQHLEGRMAYLEGDYTQAIQLLEQSISVSKKINKGNYLEGLHYLAMAFAGAGKLSQSTACYEQYIATMDTLHMDEQMRLFADMEIRYRTEEKEQEIASMTNAQKLNELELKNATRQKYFLIVCLSALGIISLLLYRFYLQKEKNNKKLNDQNHNLDQLNHRLAVANESKARLLGIFSHDLRAPIGHIAQFLRLQKENPGLFTDEKSKEYQHKFTEATDNLLNTMEDLVVWSKSQMENFNPEFTEVAVKHLVDRKIFFFSELIKEKDLRVHNHVDTNLMLKTDINYLTVILRNLMQNALKYSQYQSDLSIAYDKRKLSICNNTYQPIEADSFHEMMKGQTMHSRSNGMGLQLALDLAERLGLRLYFEVHDTRVCAFLEFPPEA